MICLWGTTEIQPSMTLLTFQKKFQVANLLAKGNVLLVKNPNSGVCFKRHPNDLKRVNKDITFNEEKKSKGRIWQWVVQSFDYISQNDEYNNETVDSKLKRRGQGVLENGIQIMYNKLTSGLSRL